MPSILTRATVRRAVLCAAVLLILVPAAIYVCFKAAGVNPFVRYGGIIWIPVHAGDPWIPRSLALALRNPPPAATAGAMAWLEVEPGFEVAELPVNAEGIEVDRILLVRVDPGRFRFAVRSAPAGDKNIDGWMAELGAALVVNGSYFSRSGTPATPVVSDGLALGPDVYDANQGAFVSAAGSTEIRDLASQDWRDAFRGAEAGMVSYPLLLAADGSSRAPRGTRWLANRTFVGEDRSGHIILGTTAGAFFSLDRLADFLKQAPLDLSIALNLDGGPVACQAIKLRGLRRRSCGRWEIQVDDGGAWMLPPWRVFSAPPMPIVLAVFPKLFDGGGR